MVCSKRNVWLSDKSIDTWNSNAFSKIYSYTNPTDKVMTNKNSLSIVRCGLTSNRNCLTWGKGSAHFEQEPSVSEPFINIASNLLRMQASSSSVTCWAAPALNILTFWAGAKGPRSFSESFRSPFSLRVLWAWLCIREGSGFSQQAPNYKTFRIRLSVLSMYGQLWNVSNT